MSLTPPSAGQATAALRPAVLLAPLGVWLVMAVLAVANGVFREVVLIPRIGEYPGHVLSTSLLVAAILAVSAAFFLYGVSEFGVFGRLLTGLGQALLYAGALNAVLYVLYRALDYHHALAERR